MPDSTAAVTAGEVVLGGGNHHLPGWRRTSHEKAARCASENAFTNKPSTKVQQLFSLGGASGQRQSGRNW
ncbi:uncharacterized protein STAUR_2534 [Stigmatella aurantiaca DW4/3-1]|uniref:Uncharacterized protein n=1 Tax=Stigmatella aurantiaca (strain DW4/3-1) TaxID=378806 RepID=Q090B4_STIAD|nr:uncharacterized protein STAUR_2534 [Stigmatella aurantiaca DW4/3-1]EAU66082.1 hypothetical protein STIAU_1430 [Stigmatella aurantiaca DW4/3-1]